MACSSSFAESTPAVEEVRVWGESRVSSQAGYTNPSSLLTPEDMKAINATTTEDLVKFEPSIVIRKRYIGDANGTLGLRGSNMFATARSMVFADGVPLHYLLQTRWSGAPRWTLVSASEIAQVEVLYGPFSAEYSGNAMGGVVLIETAIPQKQETHLDLDYFVQDYRGYGFSDHLQGYKTFFSYGNKIDDWSIYFSYNRLENDSQPQSYYFDNRAPSTAALPVEGAVIDRDVLGNTAYYFGDTGVEQATTNNYKFKLGYEFEDWFTLLNLAYEDRSTLRDQANSYLRDDTGITKWSGQFIQNGVGLNLAANRLGASDLTRRSLSTGVRLKGQWNNHLTIETNLSDFRILEDTTRASSHSLQDPFFNGNGQTTDYQDTGWHTLESKLTVTDVGIENLEAITGFRYESYQLNVDVYDSLNWLQADQAGYTSRSGGSTKLAAAFLQMNWALNDPWSLSIGGRYEAWQSEDGYFSQIQPGDNKLILVAVDDSKRQQFSPKFSLGYQPESDWLLRYSFARAYRFPIVEELFTQSQSYSIVIQATPDLKPENGLHHNLLIEKTLDGGYLRLNIFTETIRDAIESQSNLLPGGGSVTTFSAIDQVDTDGIEIIINRYGLFLPTLDIRFNLAYIKSIIVDNTSAEGPQPDSSIEGNDYPRLPRWRSNLLATYHINDRLDFSANLQYADKSFGRLDNQDIAQGVMGAQDGYTRIGVKTSWAQSTHLSISAGIDNLTNETSYVAHPWPGRSYFLSISYQL